MALFNKENAAEAARKSHESRRAAKLEAEQPKPQPQTIAPAEPIAVEIADAGFKTECNAQVVELESQLASIDAVLKGGDLEPKEWHMMTTARKNTFESWCRLKGIPLPGSARPTKGKASVFSLPDPV